MKIAVEIQSFTEDSSIHALHSAVGQYVVYRAILRQKEPDRILYLAVSESVMRGILAEPIGKLLIEDVPLLILVFNTSKRSITRWIDSNTTEQP